CHAKSKFVENGYLHPFCSLSCARAGGTTGEKAMGRILEGCQSTGKRGFSYYCSKEHGKEAVSWGNVPPYEGCKVYPQCQSVFCKECVRDTEAHPVLALKELHPDDTTFKQGNSGVCGNRRAIAAASPTVEKIYEIPNTRQLKTRQKKFSKMIQRPIETRTYFSSMCVCDMGVNAATTCKEKTCGVGNTIRSSFECLSFGAPYHIGRRVILVKSKRFDHDLTMHRYGKGIYFYRNPSFSDQFTYTMTTSPYRISIACATLVDRKNEVCARKTFRNER
ncbi:hypothetical protein L218DRAFT_1056371, partial [Marasmius fiardii PR-910]